jgi:hypothetical protein
MQRRLLSREDRKTINRWYMINAAIYSSFVLVTLLLVAFSSASRNGESVQTQLDQRDALGTAIVDR